MKPKRKKTEALMAVGSTQLLDEIILILRKLESLCNNVRGHRSNLIFMSLNAARRNVAKAGATASLMSCIGHHQVDPRPGQRDQKTKGTI